MADGTEAGIIVPAYWSGDSSKFNHAAAVLPSGTILCGAPGFRNDLPWYGSDSAPTGTGSGQSQTRDGGAAATIATCQGAGLKVCPYIAMNGATAGRGFDGHYSDLNAVLGKIDLAFANYPEYDGVFCDEAPLGAGGAAFMASVVARIHSHGGIAIANLASYQQYDGAQDYGDYLVLAETAWDSSGGFGGPYGAITNSGDPNFIAQPGFVAAWPRDKIVYWIFGVPNTTGMARTARARLYEAHNVGNIYLSNRSAYFERWASPADDPLLAEQAALSGAVIPPAPGPPSVGGVGATVGTDGTTATIGATASEALDWVVAYGTTTGYGSTATQAGSTTLAVALTGLTPGLTYYYRITGTDADSNAVTTLGSSFLAAATPAPTPSPTPDAPAAAIRAIEESPFAGGAVAALAGDALLRSFDRGAHWAATLRYADPALVARRLATGHFADLTGQADYAWVAFAGTSGNVQSRLLNEAGRPSVDWPAAARPAQPTGLTIGLAAPELYVADVGGAGTGRIYAIDDFTGGGTLTLRAYDTAFGPPRDLLRDGFYEATIYGIGDDAAFKTDDKFATVDAIYACAGSEVGAMVAYGRLRAAPVVLGRLIASVFRYDAGENPATDDPGIRKLIRLQDGRWTVLGDHPCTIPAADLSHPTSALAGGAYTHRPLLHVAGDTYLTWAYAADTSPNDSTIVYPYARAGTANLHRSTDGCLTWSPVAGIGGVSWVDRAADGTLYAVAEGGEFVMASGDDGATWATVFTQSPLALFGEPTMLRLIALACDPLAAGTVAILNGAGVRATTNAFAGIGANVGPANTLSQPFLPGLARVPAGDATVYLRANPSTVDGVYLLADGAGSAGNPSAVKGALLRRAGAHIHHTGTAGALRSIDGGASWTAGYPDAGRTSRDVAYDPGTGAWYLNLARVGAPAAKPLWLRSADDAHWDDIGPRLLADTGADQWEAYHGGMTT